MGYVFWWYCYSAAGLDVVFFFYFLGDGGHPVEKNGKGERERKRRILRISVIYTYTHTTHMMMHFIL